MKPPNPQTAHDVTPPAPPGWAARLHAWLLPDYNRRAGAYWWAVVTLGLGAIGLGVHRLALGSSELWLHVLAGMGIAVLAGLFPVRIPQSKNSFAAGEIFVFLLLLMHGAAAASLAAAAEAAAGSWRSSKRWSSRIASPAMAALAMTGVGSAMEAVLGTVSRPGQAANAGWIIAASLVMALTYFVVSSVLLGALPRLKRCEWPWPRWADLVGVFGWVGIAYAASGAVAALLFLAYSVYGVGVVLGMLPVLAMLLATLHHLFGQQEAAVAADAVRAEAAAREAKIAERHMRELEASERRFHSAFTHASIGMVLLANDGRMLQTNPALRALLGQREESLVGQAFQDMVEGEGRALLEQQLHAIARGANEGFELELCCRGSAGALVWVAAHCSFFSEPGADPEVVAPCLILQVQDITARRNAERGLHHLAFHDSLTGLPNRRRFHELLSRAVEASLAAEPIDFAVMFLDFDRFKLINDSLGHDAGDEFLVQVSRRIQESLRPGDLVARLGGDEFGVLVQKLHHDGQVVALAERLMEALKRPFHVAGTELATSASIGITFSKFGYTTPEHVLRDADTAMYKAKGAGKARYALFDTSLHTEVANRLRLEGDLRHAIDAGELTLAYQPVVELASGRLTGFEALVRWKHPADGDIAPGTFLPIAEEAGMMVRISDFVLHCACRQLRQWQDEQARRVHEGVAEETPPLTMSLNISGHDIAHQSFTARVSRALIEAGVQARHVTLELTEHILMSRLEGALLALGELRRLGVGLAVDDFGTGYSSLSHLATLPIDTLKIDRSFVARLSEGSKEAAVVRSIVLLGSSLGKVVLAEGIETEDQLEQLRAMGCALGQGFLLAPPLAADEVEARLSGASWRERPPAAGSGAVTPPTIVH